MPDRNHFLGKRIVIFTAHPDDETIAAGTMYANHKAGGETFLICATDGERGKSHLPKQVSDRALKKIRRGELLRAAKVLKIDKVIFLGLPDARVKENAGKLFEKALPIIKGMAPDQIISFGPDGMTGHLDHIAVGKVALKIAKKLRMPLAAVTIADERIAKIRRKFFLARRKFGKYTDFPKHRKSDITIKVDAMTKRRAMRSHVSQFGTAGPFSQLPKKVRDKMFAYEHFVKEKI